MKHKPLNLFIIFIYLILGAAIVFTENYYSERESLEKLSNSFYDNDAVFFFATNQQIDYTKLYNALPNNTMLFSQLESNADIRGVAIKGKINEIPKLKSGRFFKDSDFIGNKNKYAVVGCDVPITKLGYKKFITYKNISYQVIGVIGYSIPTKLDKTVMLTLNSNLVGSRFLYSINGNSTQKKFDFLGHESLFGNVTVYDRKYPSLLKVIDSDQKQVINIIVYGIVLFFNSFLLCYFWIEIKTDEIIIKKINGYSNRLIVSSICCELSIFISIGYALGVVLALILSINEYSLNFPLYFFSYIITLAISVLFVVCKLKRLLVEISKRKLGVSC